MCAGFVGFWEEEEEEEEEDDEDEEDKDTGGGGGISFFEGSEEGLGIFVLEDSLWEDEDEEDWGLTSFSSLILLLS